MTCLRWTEQTKKLPKAWELGLHNFNRAQVHVQLVHMVLAEAPQPQAEVGVSETGRHFQLTQQDFQRCRLTRTILSHLQTQDGGLMVQPRSLNSLVQQIQTACKSPPSATLLSTKGAQIVVGALTIHILESVSTLTHMILKMGLSGC